MIITVTMNPAIDKTAQTSTIASGGLNRLENVVIDAGGKGINVSKMIWALGGDSVASGFLGGATGGQIVAMLNEQNIKTDFIEVAHQTRTNLKVLSADFGITEFNESGSVITPTEMDSLRRKLLSYAKPGSLFVIAGSLPQGAAPDTYKKLITTIKEAGATVFLDADGEAFRTALFAKPGYIKPNKFELMQYFDKTGELSLEECTELCLRLIRQGVKMTALSMGADGALFVTKDEALYSPALQVKTMSTVGAGDSMVGALAYAFDKGMDLSMAASLAMAASAGAVMTQSTKPPDRKTIDKLLKQVNLQKIY